MFNIIFYISSILIIGALAIILKRASSAAVLGTALTAVIIIIAFGFKAYCFYLGYAVVALAITFAFPKKRATLIADIYDSATKTLPDTFSIIGVMLISAILGFITKKSYYEFIYYVNLSVAAATTLSSFSAVLPVKTYNVLTFKPMKKGLSGGISIVGAILALVGALIVSGVWYLLGKKLMYALLMLIIGFVTAIIKCFLGQAQEKFKCAECGAITEKKTHCNKETVHYFGIVGLENNSVRFISILLASGVALALGISFTL